MPLTGDLASIDLASVFQMLHLSQKTGTLEVRTRAGRFEVFLQSDHVLYPFDRDAFPAKVLRRLERAGILDPGAVARARASLGVVDGDLFAVLARMRAVSEEEVLAAFRLQMEEEIYELFVDRDATFEFREDQRPSLPGRVIDERLRLNGGGLIMEAARRIDEWGFIRERIPSDACIFEAGGGVESLPESERDDALAEVLGALDGVRSVAAVTARTGLSRFTVCKKLALLVEARLAYEVPLEVLQQRADRAVAEGRHEEGLALLARAFELGADEIAAHDLAARANEQLKRPGEASRHWLIVAGAHERDGDRAQAVAVHLRVRALMPTEIRSRERLVHAWLDDPGLFTHADYDAEKEAIELAGLFKALGHAQDGRDLLVEVHGRYGADSGRALRLADLVVELGDAKAAVKILLDTGDAMLEAHRSDQALRLFRRVRSIDPNQPGLPSRLAECARAAPKRRAPDGRAFRLAAGLVVLVGAAVLLFLHHRAALAEYAELPTEELAAAGDFDGARALLDRFRREHRFTVAAFLAEDEARTLDDRAQRAAAESAARGDSLRAEAQRRQRGAERAYADAVALLQRRDTEAALAAMERAAALACDPGFLARERPVEKAAELRAHVEGIRERLAAHEAAVARGDVAERRRLALELLRDEPGLCEQRGIRIPVRVSVDPEGARLRLENAGAADPELPNPALLLLAPGAEATLRATFDGRVPSRFKVRPEEHAAVHVTLDREPDGAVRLPAAALHPPAILGGQACFACEGGRVFALDAGTLDVAWEMTLSDLEEAGGAPEFDGRGLRIPLRSGQSVWIDPATGEEIEKQPDPRGGAALAASLSVALPDGTTASVVDGVRIVRSGAAGAAQSSWRAAGPLRWGVAVPGGALFGGGEWVIRIELPLAGGEKSGAGDGR